MTLSAKSPVLFEGWLRVSYSVALPPAELKNEAGGLLNGAHLFLRTLALITQRLLEEACTTISLFWPEGPDSQACPAVPQSIQGLASESLNGRPL